MSAATKSADAPEATDTSTAAVSDAKSQSAPAVASASGEKPLVLIDDREQDERAASIMAAHSINAVTQRLAVGDYAFGEVGVEFKTISDLLESVKKGYFFRQLEELEANYAKPVLVVQGDVEAHLASLKASVNKFRYMPWRTWAGIASRIRKEFWGIIDSQVKSRRVGVVLVPDVKTFRAWLTHSALRESKPTQRKHETPLLTMKSKDRSLHEEQEDMLCALSQIGRTAAKALLANFGTPARVFLASEQELQTVKGVGPKTAAHIRAVLTSEPKAS